MSVTKQLVRSEWERYFDRFTKRYLRDDRPEAATIELLSPELGDQTSAEGVALLGIVFEPKEDTLEVLLDGVDHLVFHPEEIWVVEDKDGFVSGVEIVRAGGDKEILSIRHAGLPSRAQPERAEGAAIFRTILSYESDGYAATPVFLRQVEVHAQQVLDGWRARRRDADAGAGREPVGAARSQLPGP